MPTVSVPFFNFLCFLILFVKYCKFSFLCGFLNHAHLRSVNAFIFVGQSYDKTLKLITIHVFQNLQKAKTHHISRKTTIIM